MAYNKRGRRRLKHTDAESPTIFCGGSPKRLQRWDHPTCFLQENSYNVAVYFACSNEGELMQDPPHLHEYVTALLSNAEIARLYSLTPARHLLWAYEETRERDLQQRPPPHSYTSLHYSYLVVLFEQRFPYETAVRQLHILTFLHFFSVKTIPLFSEDYIPSQ